ncbi:MAG: hypothetical protein EZS28_020230, partial [Streblomastix strix]
PVQEKANNWSHSATVFVKVNKMKMRNRSKLWSIGSLFLK